MQQLRWFGLLTGLSCCAVTGAAFAAPVPLEYFARDPAFESAKISPSGEYLAVTLPKGDQTVLAVMRLADRKITGALRLGQPKEHVYQFWWAGPSRVVYSIATQDGPVAQKFLTGELAAMDADGKHERYLFGYRGPSSLGINRNSSAEYAWAQMVDPRPEDPSYVIASVQQMQSRGDGITRLVQIDKNTGNRRELGGAPINGEADFLVDREGQPRYVVVNDLKQRLQTFWRATGEQDWKPETVGELANAQIVPLSFSEDGKAVYLSSTEAGDKKCLVRRNLVEPLSRQTLACDAEADLSSVIYSFDRSEEPIAVMFEAGKPRLQILDTENPDRELLEVLQRSFGDSVVLPLSSTLDGSKIVLLVYSDRDPGAFYLFDRKTRKAEFMFGRRDWIKPEDMAERRPIRYKARDGYTLHGYLTLPSGRDPKNLPLIVNPHGGPFGVRDDWSWDADAQAFASRGYAVLQVNFRGSGGYGTAHRDSAKRKWGTLMIDDITDGVRSVIDSKIADAKRICIYGASFGGYAAMMSAVREPEMYRCVVGYVGAYDLEIQKSSSDTAESRGGRNYLEGFVGASAEELKAQSPLTYIDRLKAPVFIVHGELDRRVPFSQAKALRKALDQRKLPYEWLSYSDEGHGFYRADHRLALYEKMIAFFDQHLAVADQ